MSVGCVTFLQGLRRGRCKLDVCPTILPSLACLLSHGLAAFVPEVPIAGRARARQCHGLHAYSCLHTCWAAGHMLPTSCLFTLATLFPAQCSAVHTCKRLIECGARVACNCKRERGGGPWDMQGTQIARQSGAGAAWAAQRCCPPSRHSKCQPRAAMHLAMRLGRAAMAASVLACFMKPSM